MGVAGGKEKLLGVQYLRAVAALMVAYFHLIGQLPAYQTYLEGTRWIRTVQFGAGVHIFFVISGLVMYVSAIESTPGRFLWRRVVRIVPLYWSLTILLALLCLVAPHMLRETAPSGSFLAKSLAFVPAWNPAQPGNWDPVPLLVPGWSLNYEMFFYAIFGAALFCPLRWRLATVLSVLAALFTLGAVSPPSSSAAWFVYTSPNLTLFAAGMILGWAYRRGFLKVPKALAIAVSAAMAILVFGPWPTNLATEYCALALIVGGIAALDSTNTTPNWRWPMLLGDASYSIYLVHIFAFGLIRAIWKHVPLGGAPGAIAFALVSMAAAIALSLATYAMVEKPSTRWLRSRPMRELDTVATVAS